MQIFTWRENSCLSLLRRRAAVAQALVPLIICRMGIFEMACQVGRPFAWIVDQQRAALRRCTWLPRLYDAFYVSLDVHSVVYRLHRWSELLKGDPYRRGGLLLVPTAPWRLDEVAKAPYPSCHDRYGTLWRYCVRKWKRGRDAGAVRFRSFGLASCPVSIEGH